jgi:hydrogenase maturation protease
MSAPRILVAGIGNIFQGDDAFGVEVAQRLLRRGLGAGVRVEDFGIRGYDLAYALMDDFDAAILVDATARGGAPGTLYTIEPEVPQDEATPMSAHSLDPASVLRMVQALGAHPKRVLVVGCEPAELGGEEGAMGLSPAVAAAIEPAIAMIDELISKLQNRDRKTICA